MEHLDLALYINNNFLDFMMLYYFCKNFTRHKIEFFSFEPEKLSIAGITIKMPAVVWGIIYGILLGTAFYFLEGNTFRIIVTFAFIAVIKFLSKRVLADVLLIYALFLFFGLLVQGLFALLVLALPLKQDIAVAVISQFLTTAVICWMSRKTSIYKVFNYIRTNILLKISCFLVALIAFFALFIVNYELSVTYFLFFVGIILTILAALIPLGTKLYRRIELDVARSHYIANQILATQIAAAQTNNPEEIKNMIDELVSHISPKSTKKANTGNLEESIRFLIEQKKSQKQVNVEVIMDIKSSENHENITIKQLLSFIGLLLDNAFESETTTPIVIYCRMNAYSIDLAISNEYLQKGNYDLEMMFEKGYSTKADEGRGYGLYEIRNEIESLNGKIEAFVQYFDEYKGVELGADYLVFRIQFWN